MVDGENDNTGYVIRLASALRCVLRFIHFKRSLMILMITIVADFRWEYMLLQISNQFSIQSLDNPMVIRMYDISVDLRVLNQYAFKLRYLNLLENPLSFAISFISHTENEKTSNSAFHITNISNENNKITNGLDSVYLRCKRIINDSKS